MISRLIPEKTDFLLRITIEHELKSNNHVNYSCKKAGQTITVVARIKPFMMLAKLNDNKLS